jgi:hypothetical protein
MSSLLAEIVPLLDVLQTLVFFSLGRKIFISIMFYNCTSKLIVVDIFLVFRINVYLYIYNFFS